MTPAELLTVAWQTVLDTVAYLLAYAFAPVWAFVATGALLCAVRTRRVSRLVVGKGGLQAWIGRALAAMSSPTSSRSLDSDLRRLGRPVDIFVFLAIRDHLSLYYLFLIGPLLGKDVLLSHALGAVFFVLAALALTAVVGFDAEVSVPTLDGHEEPLPRALIGELGRYVAVGGYGLVLGGLVAAWGLSSRAFAPVALVGPPLLSQVLNAIGAVALSSLSFMAPVANIFVGTYLWKTGLAHAGLVAFFFAGSVSPQRLRLYARIWGRRSALQLGVVFSTAAVMAGVLTALLYAATPLTIRYKLLPGQLLGGG